MNSNVEPFYPSLFDYQHGGTVYDEFEAQCFPSYPHVPMLPGVAQDATVLDLGFDLPPFPPATNENRCNPISILGGHSLPPAPIFNHMEFPSMTVYPDPASALDTSLLQPEHIFNPPNPGILPAVVEAPAFDTLYLAPPALEATVSVSFPWPVTPMDQRVFNHPPPFKSTGPGVPFSRMTKATSRRVVKKQTQKTRRKNLKEEDRYQALLHDPFVYKFTTTKVLCSGCDQVIKLDSRKGARYYLQAWRTHKSGCDGIESGIVSVSYHIHSSHTK